MAWWWYFGADVDLIVDATVAQQARIVVLERMADDLYAVVLVEMCDQGLIGLAVGVVRSGSILYLAGYGHDVAEERVPVHATQTMFRWASVSKTVTGLATAQVALLDGVNIDADVLGLVPEYVMPLSYTFDANADTDDDPDFQTEPLPPGSAITLRMLVSNTSGIKHYANGLSAVGTPPASQRNDPAINTDLFWAGPYFWDDPDHLIAVPGTEYDYSSYGFNLAAMAIERAGSLPLTFWVKVRDRIAVPFGMTPAGVPDCPPDGFVAGTYCQPDHEWVEIPRRAVGYKRQTVEVDGETFETDLIERSGSSDVSWKAPAGGFISTVQDFARFCLGLLTNPQITDPMRTMMWSPTMLSDGSASSYGLGFNIGSRNGLTLVSHSGSQQKSRTRMYIYPDDGTCFAVMTNSEWGDTETLVETLEDAYRSVFP